MGRLKEGLYDQLVTQSVREFLDQGPGQNLNSLIDQLEEADRPAFNVSSTVDRATSSKCA